MSQQKSPRVIWLYENASGNVPKDLLKYFAGMADLIANVPEEHDRGPLDKQEYARLRRNLVLLQQKDLTFLCRTDAFARVEDELYLVKIKSKAHNPRFYFTAFFEGYLVVLHGLEKKSFKEDPRDRKKARQRFDDLVARGGPPKGGDHDDP